MNVKFNHIEIPELGRVTLKPIRIITISKALLLASEAEEQYQANIFSNLVISDAFENPKKSPEDVAKFSTDLLIKVIDLVVDILDIRKQFTETSESIHVRERFFKAYLKFEKSFFHKLSASLKDSLIKITSNTMQFKKVEDQLVEAVRTMGALNFKLTLPELPNDFLRTFIKSSEELNRSFGSIDEEMKKFQKNIKSIAFPRNKPLEKIVKTIAQMNLPEPYFSSALVASGINTPILHSPSYTIPRLKPIYNGEVKVKSEDAKRRRLVDGYDILSHLEQSLRDIIETKLSELHGDKWWKRGVPGDILKHCQERKLEKENPHEAKYHPIYYAYVHDYEKIIIRKDNWDPVFSKIFVAKNELIVSFSWVANVRDSIAHIRPVSDDEYLMFIAGARWIQIRLNKYK